ARLRRVRRRSARRRRMTPRAGCSYFGVRILRHVRSDLEDIAARGYTDVLHTFSENDLAYYRGTMAEIVAASHELGLAVQMAPWACRCEVCLRLYEERRGEAMPAELTPEVLAFREASTVDFLRDMLAHVASRGGRSTICLLPLVEGPHGVSDWDAVASLPGLDTLATDPYWKNFDEQPAAFVGRFARLVAEAAQRPGVGAPPWVPSFGLTRADVPDLEAAIEAAR